jgi:hypothetical protein
MGRLLAQSPQCWDAAARSHDDPRPKRLGLLALVSVARPHVVVIVLAGATVARPTCARRWLRCGAVGSANTMEGRHTCRETRGEAELTDGVSRG